MTLCPIDQSKRSEQREGDARALCLQKCGLKFVAMTYEPSQRATAEAQAASSWCQYVVCSHYTTRLIHSLSS